MKKREIKVIATSKEKGLKLEPVKSVYFSKSPDGEEGGIVNIFDDVKYQTITGFGGAFTEASAYNYSIMSKANKEKFIKAYFDADEGIGYNFGRTHINSCDFSIDLYTNVEEGDETLETFNINQDKKYIVPLVRDALKTAKNEIILFASPWSPPAYMKTNNNRLNGGKLLEEYAHRWAMCYAKYIKAMREEGINITAVSVQNEPKAIQTWESCEYTAAEEAAFIKNHLAPVFDEEGLSDIKIIIWDHNKERVYDRAKATLKEKVVRDRVWAVGYHWYTGEHFDGLRIAHEKIKKPLICTEFCCSITDDEWEVAERYAHEMTGNLNNYMTASTDWNILLSSEGGPFHWRIAQNQVEDGIVHDVTDQGCHAPILYDEKTDELKIQATFYYIGHFSKYIKRGAVRLGTSKFTDKIDVVAVKNPDGQIVTVITNRSDASMPVNLRYKNHVARLRMDPHSIVTLLY